MTDLLFFEPDQHKQQQLSSALKKKYKLTFIGSLSESIHTAIENRNSLIIVNLDFIEIDNFIPLYHLAQQKSQGVRFIGLTTEDRTNLVKVYSKYDIPVVSMDKTGINDLLVMIRYATEIQSSLHIEQKHTQDKIVGKSAAIKKIMNQISLVKDSDIHILLTGETGTGKTELARYIHSQSIRNNAPFMHLNCAAIPDTLLESELFGYKKGAFTGAINDHDGKFYAAGYGTIFLDEIGEIPSHLQAKLLKVLDERDFYPVGGTTAIKVNARIIAATNKDLVKAVRVKKFREDLYYRLNTIEINLPPLRNRKEDIAELFNYFITHFARRYKIQLPQIAKTVYPILENHVWAGNIRELQNIVESILLLNPQEIIPSDLPPELLSAPENQLVYSASEKKDLQQIKQDYAKYVYELTDKNKSKAAQILKIDIKTFRKLLNS